MQTTIQYIRSELEGIYPEAEVQSLTRIVVEWVTGWNYTQQMINRDIQFEKSVRQKIEMVVERLKNHEPVQYVLGETEFFGMKLKVTPSVLIPRQETEELIQLILTKNLKPETRILDIGTGSGCIALALKKNLKNAKIAGIDISEAALKTANENARMNQLEVEFTQRNILHWKEYKWSGYEVIVSNPPYVLESEKAQMQKNVLEYEPEQALFVSDEDPLIFYRVIAEFATKYLVEDGRLFFEINENLGPELKELLAKSGFINIEIRKDINNKNRILACQKS